MRNVRCLSWILLVCLLMMPGISLAESVGEQPYPYEYDSRFELDKTTGRYNIVSGYQIERNAYEAKQEIVVPLQIHTRHNDGSVTTVEKTIKAGEIHYLVEMARPWYGGDEVPGPIVSIGLYSGPEYPLFVQTPAVYGAMSLENRITYESCPGMAGFAVDENGAVKIIIKGGLYQLHYISEITYNEAHEVVSTAVTDEYVTYDFEATQFEEAEHPDG